MDGDPGGLVLLVGSGRQLYREYLLDGAARRRPVWLIDEAPPTWQQRYIAGASVVPWADSARTVADEQGLLDAALAVARDHRVDAVFSYDEALVIATARIADRLGLPGLTVPGAEHCRDKFMTRQALTAAGLPQPRFALARSAEEARRAAADIGYPVVVKPRGMGASIGVIRADGPADLAAAFDVADQAARLAPVRHEAGVLVEELVDGPEISVDGAVVAGRYLPLWLAHKKIGPPPFFEEVGHLVDGGEPMLADEQLRRILGDAHRALGARYGITHAEVRLTARGMVVIEVNGRLGGDLIPYLGKLATGTDPGQIAVDVALGADPAFAPDREILVGIAFCYPPEDCQVIDITVPAPGAVPGLIAAEPMVRSGAVVRLPPRAHIGRHAYVIATAPDKAECEARLAAAAGLIELRYQALNEPELVSAPRG